MKEKHESTSEVATEQAEDRWVVLEELGRADSGAKDVAEMKLSGETQEVRRKKFSRIGAKILRAYDAGERHRVDRIKSEIAGSWDGVWEYGSKAAKTEPSSFRKVTRMITDKLGIKLKRDEELREREAMRVALAEHRAEQEAQAKLLEEELARKEAERERQEAERKAEEARRERDFLAKEMSSGLDIARRDKHERFRKQRIQEIVERDLNKRLLKVDDLEAEVLMENPEVQKRFVNFEGAEIPVYDLKGLPFSVLSTTVDYRNANHPGEIGTETFRAVMENPAIWTARRDEAEQEDGFGTREANARGDTISASYYNSESNISSHVSGDLIYGFERVEGDSVIHVSNGDGATSNMAGRAGTLLTNPDVIKTLEGADGTSNYNEVLLRRYSENGVAKRPDYIIIENGRMTDVALHHARFYKIPIVNIERRIYDEKADKRGRELIDSMSENDSYQELDAKLAKLSSMSRYKRAVRSLEGIGRNYDKPLLWRGATPFDEECLEISKMEQLKRLDFIADALEAATESVESATEKGALGPQEPGQFDYFDVNIQDVLKGVNRTKHGDDNDGWYSVPGNCNWIDITFRLKGSSRVVKTRVYDGARILKLDEALVSDAIKQEDVDGADSSYYDKLEPIVRKYFEAVRENEKIAG